MPIDIINETKEHIEMGEHFSIRYTLACNNAIKNQANILRIYNSAGTEVRTLYCAATTPIAPT